MRLWVAGPRIGPFRWGASFGAGTWGRWTGARLNAPLPAMPGGVYVIVSEAGLVKIGASLDPERRCRELQTGSPYRLRVAHVTAVHGDMMAVERAAHGMLDRHRCPGEWFAVPVEVAVATIGAAAYRLGVQTGTVPAYAANAEPRPEVSWSVLCLRNCGFVAVFFALLLGGYPAVAALYTAALLIGLTARAILRGGFDAGPGARGVWRMLSSLAVAVALTSVTAVVVTAIIQVAVGRT